MGSSHSFLVFKTPRHLFDSMYCRIQQSQQHIPRWPSTNLEKSGLLCYKLIGVSGVSIEATEIYLTLRFLKIISMTFVQNSSSSKASRFSKKDEEGKYKYHLSLINYGIPLYTKWSKKYTKKTRDDDDILFAQILQ